MFLTLYANGFETMCIFIFILLLIVSSIDSFSHIVYIFILSEKILNFFKIIKLLVFQNASKLGLMNENNDILKI